MTTFDLFLAQLADPFRIGLLVALLITMRNTRAATGWLIPGLAGIVFVAVIIPLSLSGSEPFWPQMLVGLVANAVIFGVVVAVHHLARRLIG